MEKPPFSGFISKETLCEGWTTFLRRLTGGSYSAVFEDEPRAAGACAFRGETVSVFGAREGALVELHPCGVTIGALFAAQPPSVALAEKVAFALKDAPSFVYEQLGIHPNLFLNGYHGCDPVCCLFCRVDALDGQGRYRLFVRLLSLLPTLSFYRTCQGDCFLFAADDAALPEILSRVRACLKPFHFSAGVCGPYARAVSAHDCIKKAERASAASRDALMQFSECRYDAFWHDAARACKTDGCRAQDFCHEAVAQILAYDKANGSEYASSLRAYLDAGRSHRRAASALGIHRNTMAYRIRRVEQLFALPLENDALCFELQFSFRIWDCVEHSAQSEPNAFSVPDAERCLWTVLEDQKPLCVSAMRLLIVDCANLSDGERHDLCAGFLCVPRKCAVAYDDETLYAALSPDDEKTVEHLSALAAAIGALHMLTQPFCGDRLAFQMRQGKIFLAYARSLGRPADLLHASRFASTLFYLFLRQHMDLLPFCCDEVLRVMDHDFFKGTSLSNGLYAYLTHYADLKGAAREACVHRNTLDYQIKKILSLLGNAPMDERMRFEMMCTYRILSTLS